MTTYEVFMHRDGRIELTHYHTLPAALLGPLWWIYTGNWRAAGLFLGLPLIFAGIGALLLEPWFGGVLALTAWASVHCWTALAAKELRHSDLLRQGYSNVGKITAANPFNAMLAASLKRQR